MNNKICIVYTHHKLGDLIWQLPYIKSISEHHKKSVDLIVRKKTQAKNIFKDLKYIRNIFYNDFRKNIFYWLDVYLITKIMRNNNYNFVYILDKVNKPAIAAKFAGVKNIIGPGIKNQKKWLTCSNYLSDKDWKLTYSEQSQKLLKINSIKIKNIFPEISINTKSFEKKNKDLILPGRKIAFGVDSFEDYKIWYEEYFVILADMLHKKKLFDFVYLICGPDKSYISKKIIELSKKDYFIDCSQKNLDGVILALKSSNFFVGNNSGPLNLSASLKKKSFGLIANDPINELKFSKINIVKPPNYKDNYRFRNRTGMKKLTPLRVYNEIIKSI